MAIQASIDEATDNMIFSALGQFAGIGEDRRTITEYLAAGNVKNFRLEKNPLGIHLFHVPTDKLLGKLSVVFNDTSIDMNVTIYGGEE